MARLNNFKAWIPIGIGTETGFTLPLQLQLKKGKKWCVFCQNKNKIGNNNKLKVETQSELVGGRGLRSYTSTGIGATTTTMSGEAEEQQQQQEQDTTIATPASASSEKEDVVVQYVVLRRDLIDTWPLGSVVTQGCHASVAAIWQYKDDPQTLAYCTPPAALHSMHKVTLEVKGQPQLMSLSDKLNSAGILHKLWIEHPENIPTCLATKPYPKSLLSPFFRKLKLAK